MNPIAYVEIPVAGMDRVIAFYEAVLLLDLERQQIDGESMFRSRGITSIEKPCGKSST